MATPAAPCTFRRAPQAPGVGIGRPVSAVTPGGADGPALTASPTPSRGGIAFASGWHSTGVESLTVRDLQGRLVRALALVGRRAVWDGLRESGERAPDGIYFATLHADGRATTVRVSLVH